MSVEFYKLAEVYIFEDGNVLNLNETYLGAGCFGNQNCWFFDGKFSKLTKFAGLWKPGQWYIITMKTK